MFQQLPHVAGETTRERKETAASLEGIGKLPGLNAMRLRPTRPAPGSTSPGRVAMTSPSVGVKPMVVSTE